MINTLLLGLFAVQHSVMARPAFKRGWTRIIPKPVERSTYVLFSSAALLLLFHLWQPIGGIVWEVHHPIDRVVLYALFGFGWLLVLVATFLINPFDLFGLRQVWLHLRGQDYTPLNLRPHGCTKICGIRSTSAGCFLLGDAHDDGRTSGRCRRNDGVYPDRDPARGAGLGHDPRPGLCGLSHVGAMLLPAWRRSTAERTPCCRS